MTALDIEQAVAQLAAYAAIHHDIAHGGVSASVTTEGGSVPSIAKKINDIGALIVAGHNNGFLIVVADAAGRAAAQAGQIGQMLWQRDTLKLYMATGTTVGAFTLHPMQVLLDSPGSEITALTESLATVQAWLALADSNNDGIVTLAAGLKPITDAATPPVDSIAVFGKNSSGAIGVQTLTAPRWFEYYSSLGTQVSSSPLQNKQRLSLHNGVACAITTRGRLAFWGIPGVAGIMGRGSVSTASPKKVAPAVIGNNRIRPQPAFSASNVVSAVVNQNCVHALLANGTLVAAGPATAGIWDVYGSNSGTAQTYLQSIYFNDTGANKPIASFDVQTPGYGPYANSTLAAIDTDGSVWIMTNNPNTIAYSSSLTTAQRIPLKVSPNVAGWSGKTATKVRVTVNGGVLVLMSDKSLWAACGHNSTGFLGLGTTAILSNFTQIETGVDDFELCGEWTADYYTLYILQGTTLRGAGYNAQGQLGTGGTTNSSSFVTVGTGVESVRCGGSTGCTVILRKTNGTFWGCGSNTTGALGNAGTTNVSVLSSLASLDSLISTLGTTVLDWCTAGESALAASSALVTANGRGFVTGANTFGQLGVGHLDNISTWTEVLWSPVVSDEVLVQVTPVMVNAYGHFLWLTNKGRVLASGYDSNSGFTSGAPNTENANVSTLQQISFL